MLHVNLQRLTEVFAVRSVPFHLHPLHLSPERFLNAPPRIISPVMLRLSIPKPSPSDLAQL